MKSCARLWLLTSLLLLTFNAVPGRALFNPDISWLDRYGSISWNDEKIRLDNFAIQLSNQPEAIGYVYVQVAQISCSGEGVAHAILVKRYLTEVRHLPWNRVAWRDLGYGESFEVSLWLFPAGQPPAYAPKYKPETDHTFIEDCLMMYRQKPGKRHTSSNAANRRRRRAE